MEAQLAMEIAYKSSLVTKNLVQLMETGEHGVLGISDRVVDAQPACSDIPCEDAKNQEILETVEEDANNTSEVTELCRH